MLNKADSNYDGYFNIDAIESTKASQAEKFYSNLVRSFIDTRTLHLLAANCFVNSNGEGYVEYRALLERYAMLEHMPFKPVGQVTRPQIIYEFSCCYSLDAFGRNVFLTDDVIERLQSSRRIILGDKSMKYTATAKS